MRLLSFTLLAGSALAFPYKRYDNSTNNALFADKHVSADVELVVSSLLALTTITQYKTVTVPGSTYETPTNTYVSTPDLTTITQYETITVSGQETTVPTNTFVLTPPDITITQFQTVTVPGSTYETPTNTITDTEIVTLTNYITQYVTIGGSSSAADSCVPVTVTTTETTTTTTTTTQAPETYSTYLTTVPVEAIFTLSGLTTTVTQNYTLTASVPLNTYLNSSLSSVDPSSSLANSTSSLW